MPSLIRLHTYSGSCTALRLRLLPLSYSLSSFLVHQSPSFPLTQQAHSCTSAFVPATCILFLQICSWMLSSWNSGLGSNATSSERTSRSPSNCSPIRPSVHFSSWIYIYLNYPFVLYCQSSPLELPKETAILFPVSPGYMHS